MPPRSDPGAVPKTGGILSGSGDPSMKRFLRENWIYIVAPFVGVTLGGLAYQFVRGEQPRPAELQADVAERRKAA